MIFLCKLVCFTLAIVRVYCDDPLIANFDIEGGNATNVLPEITTEIVYNAIKLAQISVKNDSEHDNKLFSLGVVLDRSSVGYLRFAAPQSSANLINMNYASKIMMKAMENLMGKYQPKYNISAKQFVEQLRKRQFQIRGLLSNDNIVCSKENKFRSSDGSCNNIKHPDWGKCDTTFTRLLDPNYSDGIYKERISVTGKPLMGAREISIKTFPSNCKPDKFLSMAAAELTQVITHDITLQHMDHSEVNHVQCCSSNGKFILPKDLLHSSCMPISVEKNDPFYKKYELGCLNFVRSMTSPNINCTFDWINQINGATGYLDASLVYGSTEQVTKTLRSFKDGLMLESTSGMKHFLPHTKGLSCPLKYTYGPFYDAGDARSNQQPHLLSVEILILREHNRIAQGLKKVNPNWNDERIFQEARRINIAIYQHIVFKELLPLWIGDVSFIKKLFGCDKNGFTNNYNESINGGTINSFTIAFRSLHSTIPDDFRTCNESRQTIKTYPYSDLVLKPCIMEEEPNSLDKFIRGMCKAPMMQNGACVTSQMTTKLMKSTLPLGLDLMSMDIQRSRDHGTAGYNDFLEYCGYKKAKTFEDLLSVMNKDKIDILTQTYAHPDDIDLLVGGMFERQISGSQFGTVMGCIMKEQFYRLMIGDRYFYTHINQPYPFTPEQLQHINQVTFAGFVCQNSDNITTMPARAFELESRSNPRISCKYLKDITDFNLWKEK